MRAWLATVVRSLARQVGLSERRRDEREHRAAPHERQPATDEVVARAELQHAITTAVLALDEPYRTTVLLRYFEDLAPRAIAKRMAIPIETVRTRLKRGLELVRARYVALRGEGRRNPAVALLGLLDQGGRRVLWRMLNAKAGAAAGTSVVSTGAMAWAGAIGASTTLKLATAVAIVAAGAFALVELHSTQSSRGVGQAVASQHVDFAPSAKATPASRPQRREEGRADAPLGSDDWLAAAGLSVTPSPDGGVPLQIEQYGTGAPAAGALVLVLDEQVVDSTDFVALVSDAAKLRSVCLAVHRTDSRGEARIHISPALEVVFACDGNTAAVRRIHFPDALPITLKLRPPVSLQLKVVDSTGAARGHVPVGFGTFYEVRHDFVAMRRAQTSDDGSATLSAVNLCPRVQSGGRWVVAIDGMLSPSDSIPIDVDHPPSDPIVLALGDCGAIDFEMVDDQGTNVPFDGEIHIGLNRDGDLISERHRVSFRRGAARLDPVGLGCSWSLFNAMASKGPGPTSGVGPSRAGETVHARIPTAAAGPIVTGRLLDSDGTPLSQTSVWAMQRSVLDDQGTYRGESATAQTDAQGRFALDFQGVDLDVVRRPMILTVLRTTTSPPRRAFVQLPPHLAGGFLELGDLTVEQVPPAITGRVVRTDGQPLARVEVSIGRLDAKTTVEEYERFGFPQSDSDDDGRFSILGWPPGRYRISCRKTGFGPPRELAKDDVLTLPAQDVTLTLDRGMTDRGWVLGSVRTDLVNHEALRNVVVVFRRTDDAAAVPAIVPFDDLGRLAWNTQTPGIYDAVVTLREVDDARELLARIDGIDVKADAVTIDPRLQQLDLRGRLHEIVVRVTDADGRPARDVLVRGYVADAPETSARFAFAGSEPARFLTTQSSLDVDAIGPDGTFVSQPDVNGEAGLRLEHVDPIRVKVTLDPPDALANQPLELTVILLPARSLLDGWPDWLASKFDATGVAAVTVPCAGAWRAHVVARGKHRISFPRRGLIDDVPLTIPDGAREASCTIRLDERKIAALVEATKDE